MTRWETAKKWESLGVEIYFYTFRGEYKQLKTYSDRHTLSDFHDAESLEGSSCNIMALRLSDVPMFCLDIDNKEGSIKKFHEVLEKNGATIEDFWHEKTRNGGYHIYFYFEEKPGNLMKANFGGVQADVIFQGNVFTSPSLFGGKSYTWGSKALSQLNSLKDLGPIPEWLDDYLSE
jgi:hypothetical protein